VRLGEILPDYPGVSGGWQTVRKAMSLYLPRSLNSLEFQMKHRSLQTSQVSQASGASHKSLRSQKDIAFKIGDEVVLRYKRVALRALVVEYLPAEPDASIITALLAEARILLDQDHLDDLKAQLRSIAWLQSTGVSMSSDEKLQFGELSRAVMIKTHLGASNLTPKRLVAPTLVVDCQKLESENQEPVPQEDYPEHKYGDARSEGPAPNAQATQMPVQQSFEPSRKDFQEGV
jgi:hypothetical protein